MTVMDRNPVTTVFGFLGTLAGLAFAIDTGLFTFGGVTTIVVGGVSGGLLGRGCWRVLVESHGYGSLPARGALAGGVTGFVWLSPFLTMAFTLGRSASVTAFFAEFTSVNAVLEFGAGFVIFAVYGLFVIGWATIPVGIITGYFLGREYVAHGNR
ncbi:hypothetical protein D3261_14320 [Halococcus sp. IIIV-5B]|nr:hypothetical protein D3261_14320 [Halococcus sp. IIIV-5B]